MFDVIVIGSGAGGSPAAWRLIEAGLKVALLEQGDDFEQGKQPVGVEEGGEYFKRNKLSSNPTVRNSLSCAPQIITANSIINPQNYYGVGGSTLLHSCMYPRLHETDFCVYSTESILDDWPISYSDLLPYYNLDVSITGVAGKSGNPYYSEYETNMPCVPLGKAGRKLAKAFKELNWHWWPSYSAINTVPFDGRAPDNYQRPSNLGPADTSKGSVNNTYLKKAINRGLSLLKNTCVTKIVFSAKKDEITCLHCINTNVYLQLQFFHHSQVSKLLPQTI